MEPEKQFKGRNFSCYEPKEKRGVNRFSVMSRREKTDAARKFEIKWRGIYAFADGEIVELKPGQQYEFSDRNYELYSDGSLRRLNATKGE